MGWRRLQRRAKVTVCKRLSMSTSLSLPLTWCRCACVECACVHARTIHIHTHTLFHTHMTYIHTESGKVECRYGQVDSWGSLLPRRKFKFYNEILMEYVQAIEQNKKACVSSLWANMYLDLFSTAICQWFFFSLLGGDIINLFQVFPYHFNFNCFYYWKQ